MSLDSYSEVLSIVTTNVAEVLDVPTGEVTADSVLLDLGAQSLDFIDLILRFERRFGISLSRDFAIPNDYSIEQYVNAILEARGSAG